MAAWSDDAFAAFHALHDGLVRRTVRAIISNPHDVDDVVQDVFLQAWRTIDKYDATRGSRDAWLTVMARSRAVDRLRARAGREFAGDVETAASAVPDPFVSLVTADRGGALMRAFVRLSFEQQHLLSLVYHDALTHSQIAALLQAPLGTVKTRIRTAVAELRAHLCGDRHARHPGPDAAHLVPAGPFTVAVSGERAPVALSLVRLDTRTQETLRGLDVLVVDDDDETLGLMVAVLTRFGARPTARASARDALASLRESWPRVMLADLEMPGDDGYSLLAEARALGRQRQVPLPVAAFTGRCSEEERVRTRVAGFDAYLTKPIHPLGVLTAVARLGGQAVA